MWQTLMAWLAWLSADPAALDVEHPKAAAAVAVARASMATQTPPAPTPKPVDPDACCGDCGGRGYIVQPDGHRTACPCPPSCKCKAGEVTIGPVCTDGRCRVTR